MAERTLFVTVKGARAYRTRMLQAGDPIVLSGPESRLAELMGYAVAAKPRASKPVAPEPQAAASEPSAAHEPAEPAPKPRRRRKKKA